MNAESSSESTAYELATLAARICPEFCRRDPAGAITEAIALLKQAHKVPALARKMDDLEALSEKWDAEHADDSDSPFRKGYERGVKLITGVKRWSRSAPDAGARDQFRVFLRSKMKTAKAVEQALVEYRGSGFTPGMIMTLGAEFRDWKAAEISKKARASQAQRKKK